jgi:DNA-binding NtrC family response regulator
MRRLVETVAVVAASDASVLILGPSGSGKEVVAELVHQWSPRARQPMIAANCAGLPESLIESELAHPWTGNVRELRNAIQRACLLCRGDIIMPEHLPPKIGRHASAVDSQPPNIGRLSQVERATILATLDECKGNRTHAAKQLGISRRALIYKLRAIETEMH